MPKNDLSFSGLECLPRRSFSEGGSFWALEWSFSGLSGQRPFFSFSFRLYPLAFYFVQHELKTRKTKAAASILKKHQTFTTAPDFSLPIESMAINSSTNRNYREAIDSFSSASVGRGKG